MTPDPWAGIPPRRPVLNEDHEPADYDDDPGLPPEDSAEAEEGAMIENQRMLEYLGWGRNDT